MSHKSSSAKIWRKFGSRYPYPEGQVKLITWSVVHAAPLGLEDQVPYTVAIVEAEDGERFTTQLVDIASAKLKYGLKLRPTLRRYFTDGVEGLIHYGVKYTI